MDGRSKLMLGFVQVQSFLTVLILGYISYEQAIKEIERLKVTHVNVWDGI